MSMTVWSRILSVVGCGLAIGAVSLTGCTKSGNRDASVVRLATWADYVSPEAVEDFQKRTSMRLEISTFGSNEELLAKFQAGAGEYDVVMPSDYMVSIMIKMDLLRPIQKDKIEGFKAIQPWLLSAPFDPENTYSVPFDWGTTGLAFNLLAKDETRPLGSWKEIFDSGNSFRGRIALLDDMRESLGVGLRYLGYSINSTNPVQIKKAAEFMKNSKSFFKTFTSDTVVGLLQQDFSVALAYSPDALKVRSKLSGNVKYLLPKEGCTFWIDNLVIPRTARNLAGAQRLIEFFLEKEVMARTVKTAFTGPARADVVALLSPEYRNDTALLPSRQEVSRCEMITDLGEATQLWERAWTEVKSFGQ